MSTNNTTHGRRCININDVLRRNMGDISSEPVIQAVFCFFYATVILLGVFGNLCVIVAVARNRALRTVRNLFLVNLSFSDILVSLLSGTITPVTAFQKVWMFGDIMCQVVPLLQGSSIWISTFTLMAIAVDRFILIVYPAKKPIQPKLAINMIILIWTASFLATAPVVLKQKMITFAIKGQIPFCGRFCIENWRDQGRRAYGMTVLVMQFVFPLIVICYCYLRIYIKLSKSLSYQAAAYSVKASPHHTFSNDSRRERLRVALQRRQKTNRMLITMVVVFASCWFPQVTFHVLRDFKLLPKLIKTQEYFFGILMHWIAMTSTCWNPILYAWLNDQLRAAFMIMIKCSGRSDPLDDGLPTELRRSSFFDPSLFNSSSWNRRTSAAVLQFFSRQNDRRPSRMDEEQSKELLQFRQSLESTKYLAVTGQIHHEATHSTCADLTRSLGSAAEIEEEGITVL